MKAWVLAFALSSASPSLRLALAFWLPVYYGLFVWLLTTGEGGGGAKRRVRDRGQLVPLPAVVPARATRAVRRG